MKRLSLAVFAVFLMSCEACDSPGTLGLTCPSVNPPVGPITAETVKDSDDDGYAPCGGDCDDHDPLVSPIVKERCDGIDQDCDGVIDDGLVEECWSGSQRAFLGEPSRCRVGQATCESGQWSECRGQVFPTDEMCNEIDDDCDGVVDESVPHSCGPDRNFLTGVCRLGDQVCSGNETYCVNAVYPSAESCNSIDDDCDGNIDQGLVRTCSTACGRGVENCVFGSWEGCDAPKPSEEICNRLDDDCDGVADEGLECLCAYNPDRRQNEVGFCFQNIQDSPYSQPCGIGTTECQPDGTWGPCKFFDAVPEACNNWDDDCDGVIDAFNEQCGDEKLAGHGVCALGQKLCTQGVWGECLNDVGPTDEVCNDLDDDCDDRVDEDLDSHQVVDVWFEIDGSGSMCPFVDALRIGATVWASEFRGTKHRFGLGVFPSTSQDSAMGQPLVVLTPLTDIDSFLVALSLYDCNYGAIERGYDSMWVSADPTDPLGIGWLAPDPLATDEDLRDGAWPYIIHIGDENPGTVGDLNEGTYHENDVTSQVSSCGVGGCLATAGRFETFVLTTSQYFLYWDGPTYNEPERLIDLHPAVDTRYADEFRKILRKLCR